MRDGAVHLHGVVVESLVERESAALIHMRLHRATFHSRANTGALPRAPTKTHSQKCQKQLTAVPNQMTGSHMQISSEVLTVIGTLGGVLISAVASVVTIAVTRRSEDRRHMQKLVMEAAIESWRQRLTQAGPGARIAPLTHYVVHAAMTLELLDGRRLDRDAIAKRMDEISVVVEAMLDNARKATDGSRADEHRPG